jgi:hypothetical protein
MSAEKSSSGVILREVRLSADWPPKIIKEWIRGGGVNSVKLAAELRWWAEAFEPSPHMDREFLDGLMQKAISENGPLDWTLKFKDLILEHFSGISGEPPE